MTGKRQLPGKSWHGWIGQIHDQHSRFIGGDEGMTVVQDDIPELAGQGKSRQNLRGGSIVHIHDILNDADYSMEVSKLDGYRTMLGVPLLREGTPVGVMALVRSVCRPFTDQQIELVKTFADQAVIAIENTRLLNELRESLQQQTANADILRILDSDRGHGTWS